MWAYDSVFYQIYPLGMTGAPFENPGAPGSDPWKAAGEPGGAVQEQASAPSGVPQDPSGKPDGAPTGAPLPRRILQVLDWIPHLQKLGVDAVYFSPVFESDTHGYNTRDYRQIDQRLGSEQDFVRVCQALHQAGIRVILDGVFNHVGRGFWAFRDVQQQKWDSSYRDWFCLNFDGDSAWGDGFWYEGWEGCYDLVRLNLRNPEVTRYLLDCVDYWIDTFSIDGLRLDVAYMLDRDFLRMLRAETSQKKQDFFLLGEILHGDYREIMNDGMCHSATNYECYKGLYSSFNSRNLFEICHSLQRQFGPDPWCLYTGMHLMNFVDNHDVSRIASILTNREHLPLIYTLMFGMPGMPMIYYGSEWGAPGSKDQGDPALRPAFQLPQWNDLTEHIARLAAVRHDAPALKYGSYSHLLLTNCQCVIERDPPGVDRVLVCVNLDENEYTARFDAHAASAIDLLNGGHVNLTDGLRMPPYSSMMLRPEL